MRGTRRVGRRGRGNSGGPLGVVRSVGGSRAALGGGAPASAGRSRRRTAIGLLVGGGAPARIAGPLGDDGPTGRPDLGCPPCPRTPRRSPATRSPTSAVWPGCRSTEDELDHYSAQLADILAAVARVTEVATPDVPATSHPMPLQNVFRTDVHPAQPDARPRRSSGAPDAEDARFRVPRILDEE